MTKRFLDIRPLNLPPNNIISPSQGHPIITFDIAEQDAFLMGNSVRICGNLKITKNGADVPGTARTDGTQRPFTKQLEIVIA